MKASVEGTSVKLEFADKGVPSQIYLSPTQALTLTVQMAEAMMKAIEAGARPISDEESYKAQILVGPYSYETKGTEDGRAGLVLWPENWVSLVIELTPESARAIGESLISAAQFMEGGSIKH